MTGMSPSSGILIGVSVSRRCSVSGSVCMIDVVAEVGQAERERVEHDAEHDLVDQVPDREHGEQHADQRAAEHRRDDADAEVVRDEANSAPANAPTSIWPSIATLMTPERSHTMPASAPRISGVL